MQNKFGTAKALGTCLIAIVLLQGCGKDTVADTVNREKDREAQAAANVQKENKDVIGTFVGSEVINGEHLDIQADIEPDFANVEGVFVSQPTIGGRFTVSNQSLLNSHGKPTVAAHPFINAKYTRDLKVLVADFMDSGNVVQHIYCDAVRPVTRLDCHLKPIGGNTNNNQYFTLYRQ